MHAFALVLELECPQHLAMQRVLGRKRNVADNPMIFNRRFAEFQSNAPGIRDHYSGANIYKMVRSFVFVASTDLGRLHVIFRDYEATKLESCHELT